MTAVLETNIALEKTALERYVPPAKPSLVGLTRAALAEALGAVGVMPSQQKMRVQQLWHWIYVRGAQDFRQMTSVSKELHAILDAHYTLARPEVVAEQISVDGTRKWLLRLPGEHEGERPTGRLRRHGARPRRRPADRRRPLHLQHRDDGNGRAAVQFRGGARRAGRGAGRRRAGHFQAPHHAVDVGRGADDR